MSVHSGTTTWIYATFLNTAKHCFKGSTDRLFSYIFKGLQTNTLLSGGVWEDKILHFSKKDWTFSGTVTHIAVLPINGNCARSLSHSAPLFPFLPLLLQLTVLRRLTALQRLEGSVDKNRSRASRYCRCSPPLQSLAHWIQYWTQYESVRIEGESSKDPWFRLTVIFRIRQSQVSHSESEGGWLAHCGDSNQKRNAPLKISISICFSLNSFMRVLATAY